MKRTFIHSKKTQALLLILFLFQFVGLNAQIENFPAPETLKELGIRYYSIYENPDPELDTTGAKGTVYHGKIDEQGRLSYKTSQGKGFVEIQTEHVYFRDKKGNIDSMKSTYNYSYLEGPEEEVQYFQREGGKTIQNETFKLGSEGPALSTSTHYLYDSKDQLIEKKTLYYYPFVKVVSEKRLNTFTYDQEGKKLSLKAERFIEDSEEASGVMNAEFSYDDKGQLIESKTLSGSPFNGSFSTIIQYEYDEKGHQIEKRSPKEDGSVDRRTTWEYGENGLLKTVSHFRSNDKITRQFTLEYFKE